MYSSPFTMMKGYNQMRCISNMGALHYSDDECCMMPSCHRNKCHNSKCNYKSVLKEITKDDKDSMQK